MIEQDINIKIKPVLPMSMSDGKRNGWWYISSSI